MTGFSLDDFTKINRPTRRRWPVLGRRSRQVEVRAERQARADRDAAIEAAREQHYRHQKLYAAVLRDVGAVIPLNCDKCCPICYPFVPPPQDSSLEVHDLRGLPVKKGKSLSGKRGICKRCGGKIIGLPNARHLWYHPNADCGNPLTKPPVIERRCLGCNKVLEHPSPQQRHCGTNCRQRAYYYRHRD